MNHRLKSFIVGNGVLLVFYLFMASNTWAMPPEWYIMCDMECNYEPGGSLCYCTCMYDNWEPFPMGFPAPGPDADGDFYQDTDSGYGICIDNCLNLYNPNQKDADNDTIGDACDADTVYGTISGDVQEGVTVQLMQVSCGSDPVIDTTTTNSEGYYAFGGLENSRHIVVAELSGYSFMPLRFILDIPQAEIQPYDFTATEIP